MNKIKKIIISLIAMSAGTSALAITTYPCGFYAEGNIGYPVQSDTSYGNKNTSASLKTNPAWNVNLGYKFMPYLAAEAGYTKFPNTRVFVSGVNAAQDKHYGVDLAGKGILPFIDTGFELFAKLGATYVNSNLSINNKALARQAGLRAGSHNAVNLFIGAGGEYYIMPNIPINIQWQRSNADSQTGRFDVYSIGASYLIG